MNKLLALLLASALLIPLSSDAEILALLNYESKPNDSLKDLKMPFGTQGRKEGIAIIDVDPESDNYGNILADFPLPSDLVAHHVFYNRDATKIYLTALGKPELRVIDMTANPYRIKVIDVPDCQVGEDVVFSADNKTWYLTCMGSDAVVVGNAIDDTYTHTIRTPVPYPHGIAIHEGIDRMLLTSTVRPSDLGDPGEEIAVFEASTGKFLSRHKVSNKESPSGEAPVEVVFVPGSDPPVAYITNMFGGSLWTATWNDEKDDFDFAEAFDFGPEEAGIPLEIYFTADGSEMHVTTANPGRLHFFELGDTPTEPTLVKTLDAGEGAHHVAYTKDGRYAYVQNSFINLPGMSEGSITVIDLKSKTVIDTINTFIEHGFNPNCMVLLPEWNDPMGH
ncbi:MAG: YncE family protein [Proteobacteria bacterium]|nr:YncE family protein [Pseudomonadota bacterium]